GCEEGEEEVSEEESEEEVTKRRAAKAARSVSGARNLSTCASLLIFRESNQRTSQCRSRIVRPSNRARAPHDPQHDRLRPRRGADATRPAVVGAALGQSSLSRSDVQAARGIPRDRE